MIINDSEELKKKEEDIHKLEIEIAELEKIKELNRIKEEKLALEKRIKILSSYKIEQIINIITKLMEIFEGIEYSYENSFFSNSQYNICPKKNWNNEFINIYPSLSLKIINVKRFLSNEENFVFLPPSSYESSISVEYIQKFIDYLYMERSKNNLFEITNKQLEQVLNKFINLSLQLQLERKKEIKLLIDKNIQQKKEKEFKKSCLIDRKLIYNALCYIVNHYESNINATQTFEKERYDSSDWITLNCYHKLIVTSDNLNITFSSLVDSAGCYPDEEYCGPLCVNMKKPTNICFFDLKEKIIPILKNCYYVKSFIEAIENGFYEGIEITHSYIESLLIELSNKKKTNKKLLLK